MSDSSPTVLLVDDDPAVRKALSRVLREEGWNVEVFESAEAFLVRADHVADGCLVLDVTMPGLDGLELQQRLIQTGKAMPIVFVTGYGDIPMTVRALKAGASDFLTKPVEAEALLRAVRAAIEQGASVRLARAATAKLRQRYDGLTPREREVLTLLVTGALNKQVAATLGVVEQTIKFHRAQIMERMEAKTVAELMHIAARLEIGTPSEPPAQSQH